MRYLAVLMSLLLIACEAPKPIAVTDLASRPAEQALLAGIHAYEDGQYPQAETALNNALTLKLAASRDRANAYKYLAFIYCTSDRVPQCERAFVSARQADPSFDLSRSEAGHPLWGPVYRRVLPPPRPPSAGAT